MEKEIRSIQIELRSEDSESRKIEGYAAVFDTPSLDLGGFTEVISRGAFDGVIENSDVFACFNHDNNKVLARSKFGKGSLKLSIDDRGLKYEFEAPKTALGDELLAFLRSGDINESSFAFTVNADAWEKKSDGTYLRTINKIERLYDVSPVWCAAYGDATSAICARFAEIKEEERIANEKAMKEAEEQRKMALTEYYNNLKAENKQYLSED